MFTDALSAPLRGVDPVFKDGKEQGEETKWKITKYSRSTILGDYRIGRFIVLMSDDDTVGYKRKRKWVVTH